MNRSLIVGVFLVVVGGLIGWWLYLEYNRYVIVTTRSSIAAYKIDKKTGVSWFLRGRKSILQKDDVKKKPRENAGERRAK